MYRTKLHKIIKLKLKFQDMLGP